MYTVLVFDDRPHIRIALRELFEFCDEDINVLTCKKVYEADDVWESKKNQIDAIVLDSMMSSQGLSSDDNNLSEGGLLSGWLWLWRNLNPNNLKTHPTDGKLIIMYSGYLKDINQYLQQLDKESAEWTFSQRVEFIKKGTVKAEERILELILKDKKSKCE